MRNLFFLLLTALCGAGALAAQVAVTAQPANLTFTWQSGAALPATQTVSVRMGAGTAAYVVTTPPADQWLIVSPNAGMIPASLNVRVNPSTLSAGQYVSAITVTVAGVAAPLTIPVTLNVTLPPGTVTYAPVAIPLTSPGTLSGNFTMTAGSSSATYTITTATPWLSVSPTAGAILPDESATIALTASAATLNPQANPYSGTVTVTTNSGGVTKTQSITVSFTVNAQTPTVTSVWPGTIPAGSPDTTVTIRGTNLYSGTTVTATGAAAALKVTLVSPTILLAVIPAPLLAATGNINLTVTNPAPGGPAAPYGISVGNSPSIAAITNAASFIAGPISPGEIIAIFGQNLGPQPAVQLTVAGGYAQTAVGGVAVTIDGQSAPILYASNSQVTVQVPYNARLGTQALGTARVVALTYGGAAPAGTLIDIVPAVPAIFSVDSSGTGAAIVLNFDPVSGTYTLNSKTNPAKIGSTITFFVTGEGDYAGAVYSPETGLMVPALPPPATGVFPQMSPLPTVTIGGVAATNVTYAGPVPTCMLGLLQVSAVVPVGAATGNAVPLSVNIGGSLTQAGITMSVAP